MTEPTDLRDRTIPAPPISAAEDSRGIDDPETVMRDLLTTVAATARDKAEQMEARAEAMLTEAAKLEERAGVVRARAHIATSCAAVLRTYVEAGGKAAENTRLNMMVEPDEMKGLAARERYRPNL